jgi:D-alanyl-D-alanine dipeptidase
MRKRTLRLIVMAIAALTELPVAAAQTRPASFVNAATVVPNLVVDMRYLGSDNFVGRRIDGYESPICYLTREAAAALAQVARDLEPQGLAIKAFDCYRPVRAVAHFVRWARDLRDQVRKADYYPQVDKRNLFRDGYIAARSGHSRGSTMDITLVRRGGGELGGRELDMGTPFDFFSPWSAPSDKTVNAEAQANRRLLAGAMRRRGFMPYKQEWWHFTLRKEPYPDTYFDFPVR